MGEPKDEGDLAALVEAAGGGDQEAWNEITARFTSLLWSVARSFRLSHDDAADVVQNTWLRLLEHLTTIERPEALPGWLTTTARREALGLIRRRGRDTVTRDDDLGTEAVDTTAEELDASLLETERDVNLWTCFRRLPANCQQLLRVLMATDRPNYAEVSEGLGMPIGSIGPTRMRCLARLRAFVEASGYYATDTNEESQEVRKS